jgi:hypothetical protein
VGLNTPCVGKHEVIFIYVVITYKLFSETSTQLTFILFVQQHDCSYSCEQVRPLIPELQNFQLHLASSPVVGSATLATPCNTTESSLTTIDPQQCLTVDSADLSANTVQVLGVYTTQLHTVSSALPAALLVGDDNLPSVDSSGDETSDVDIDI